MLLHEQSEHFKNELINTMFTEYHEINVHLYEMSERRIPTLKKCLSETNDSLRKKVVPLDLGMLNQSIIKITNDLNKLKSSDDLNIFGFFDAKPELPSQFIDHYLLESVSQTELKQSCDDFEEILRKMDKKSTACQEISDIFDRATTRYEEMNSILNLLKDMLAETDLSMSKYTLGQDKLSLESLGNFELEVTILHHESLPHIEITLKLVL